MNLSNRRRFHLAGNRLTDQRPEKTDMHSTMKLQPIAFVPFTDGVRPVYQDAHGQFVHDNEGKAVYGIWFVAPNEPDEPIQVEAS